ncbi:hypothetical protein HZB78_05540 [Candidatus Collierbacteria bacterium]|nr:hypothetical protein [Candidatus Collierbacteria bacterium]
MDPKTVQRTIKPLIDSIREVCFVPEYRDKVTDAECLGLAVSKFFEWDGIAISKTAIEALGDANFHTLAGKIEELLDQEFKA